MKKILLLAAIIVCAPAAFATTGGTCPSSAQYLAVSDAVTQPSLSGAPLVTLASLGVTQCFYMTSGALGNDSNTGTDETHPWQHGPHMPTCLAGSACHISLNPGQGLIIQGGSHYHYFTGSPLVGLPAGWPTGVNGYAWNWADSGAAGAEIYIGVDQGWFLGGAWSRPIFENDNATFLPPSPSPAQTTAGFASTSVASCAFPQGNLDDFVFNGTTYTQLDNIEFTGMCWNDVSTNGGSDSNEHSYVKTFGIGSQANSWRRLTNQYWHGWSHTAFNLSCSPGPPNPGSTCGGPNATIGNPQDANQGSLYAFDVCDGSDSDDLSFGCIGNETYDVEENAWRHVSPVTISDNCHNIHDNLFEFINNSAAPGTHTDLFFCVSEYPLNNFVYNNMFRFIATEYSQAALSTVFWFGGTQVGATCGGTCNDFVFNNVGHDVNCNGNCNNIGGPSTGIGGGGITHYNIYNNTWETPLGQSIWRNENAKTTVITDLNNHYITGAGTTCTAVYTDTTSVNGGVATCPGDLFQTVAAANTQGYVQATDFLVTPGSPRSTVGSAANETSLVSSFGTAFASSTTAACSYNATNHTVFCPAVTPQVRPTSGTCTGGPPPSGAGCWDLGASQLNGSVTLTGPGGIPSYTFANTFPPNPSPDSPVTFTFANNTGSTVTPTVSLTGANSADFGEVPGSPSCASPVTTGSNCQISVSFAPLNGDLGLRNATLQVTYTGAGGGTVTASLSGTSVSPIVPAPALPAFTQIRSGTRIHFGGAL